VVIILRITATIVTFGLLPAPAGPCSDRRGALVRTPAATAAEAHEPERTDAIDLGRDRGRLSPTPPHDQALGWAAVVVSGSIAAGSLPPAIR
jgi:hypothetical protein